MHLSRIHHVAIIVSDYAVSKDFYVNKLGFSIVRENYRPERDDWKLDLRLNDETELEIFGVKKPPRRICQGLFRSLPGQKKVFPVGSVINYTPPRRKVNHGHLS